MPPRLCDFDAPAWGWSGPHYVEGVIVEGYRQAWQRFLEQRTAWCDEHPAADPITDIIRRHPDEPWPISGVDS